MEVGHRAQVKFVRGETGYGRRRVTVRGLTVMQTQVPVVLAFAADRGSIWARA